MTDALQILFWVVVSMTPGSWVVRGYWRAKSEVKRSVEGEAPWRSSRKLIWRKPDAIRPIGVEVGPLGVAHGWAWQNGRNHTPGDCRLIS